MAIKARRERRKTERQQAKAQKDEKKREWLQAKKVQKKSKGGQKGKSLGFTSKGQRHVGAKESIRQDKRPGKSVQDDKEDVQEEVQRRLKQKRKLDDVLTTLRLPEATDSNIQAEEDERLIRYLEANLGIKGDKAKKKKLQKDIAKTEFGGEDLIGFAEAILEGGDIEKYEKELDDLSSDDFGLGSGDDSGGSGDDSGVSGDDGGVNGEDSGVSGDDSGVSGEDSGVSEDDSGVSGEGSGVSGDDSGVNREDSDVSGEDSGVSGDDSGVNREDSGVSGDDMSDGEVDEAATEDAEPESGSFTKAPHTTLDEESLESEDNNSGVESQEASTDEGSEVDTVSDQAPADSRTGTRSGDPQSESTKPAPTKYVPPHLKKTNQQPQQSLKQKLRSYMNRAAEGNLNVVLEGILKELKAEKERVELSSLGSSESSQEAVKRFVLSASREIAECSFSYLEAAASGALLAPQLALVCGLSGLVSTQVVAEYCRISLTKFKELLLKLNESTDNTSTRADVASSHFQTDLAEVDGCRHITIAIGLLAYFECLGPDLQLAFGQYILGTSELCESVLLRRLDFLCSFLRIAGVEMKREYPQHYGELVTAVQERLNEVKDVQNSHVSWLQHELSTMGRTRRAPMFEKFTAMKNWLQSKSGHFRGVVWKEVMLDCVTIDASSYLTQLMNNKIPEQRNLGAQGLSELQLKNAGEVEPLLELANRLRIRAPLQQRVFVCLMGAEDLDDALIRVLALAKDKASVAVVVSVVLHCLLMEKIYNEFYEKVLLHLCQSPDKKVANKFTRAVRQGIHATASTLSMASGSDAETMRKKAVLFKLIKFMIKNQVMASHKGLFERLNSVDTLGIT
eukprot:Blabericola_migrator_1__2137@NODE_158_length_12591_cov_218_325775_g138_i0_p2_GENE_NODE_158_length_12591_cov_218_325775_g138_i0NODE_158_length_12591_cov_218_325775_g138_i0_p2_ORF_typecomplete_len851_score256_31MA3/PF02847_17/3e11_NODE_158_length_12591_cov_218_325775_g138_i0799110543